MCVDLFNRLRTRERELVEKRFVIRDLIAVDLAELRRGIMRFLIAKFGDLAQSLFAKQRKINRRAEGDQSLIGADVGRGTFTLDVLFTRCEREDIGALTFVIDRFADETPRHLVDVLLARREKANAWSAIPHRDAQRLPVAYNDVCAHRAGSLEEGEGC